MRRRNNPIRFEKFIWVSIVNGTAGAPEKHRRLRLGEKVDNFIYAMNSPAKYALRWTLAGISKACLMLGAGLFLVGGGLIHVFFKVERFLAEVEGISLSVIFCAASFLLKPVADGLSDSDGIDLPDKHQPENRES
jgi:hypothetical protein